LATFCDQLRPEVPGAACRTCLSGGLRLSVCLLKRMYQLRLLRVVRVVVRRRVAGR
jgi:hypothetical protein